jgi:predicted alpha-1,2-mannosidase
LLLALAFGFSVGAGLAQAACGVPDDPLAECNLRIGTGGLGYGIGGLSPGPQVPFGLVRLGPDTSLDGVLIPWRHGGGYHAQDTHIRYFSHLHSAGAGMLDGGNIGVMAAHEVTLDVVTGYGYRSRFRAATEVLEPGYYAVTLEDVGVRAELTATRDVGLHRYTFGAGERAVVLVDLFAALGFGAVKEGQLTILPKSGVMEGWVHNEGDYSRRYGGYDLYFVARFDRAMTQWGVWREGVLEEGATEVSGRKIGAWADFGAAGDDAVDDAVELAVAVSLIDAKQARANLRAQVGRRDFDAVRRAAEDAWRAALAVVEIEGGSEEQRTIFRTALYHAQIAPTELSEEGGRYLGFDRQVHVADGWHYYSDLSLWDTFRTQAPLLVLLAPEQALDVVRSMLAMLEQGGDLPKWAHMIGYTGGMIGSHSDVVIADAYLKGLREFDVEAAYAAMRRHAMEPRPHGGRSGIEDYLEMGYCPQERVDEGVSRTLEFALDDWAIGNLAAALGHADDAALFAARAENYRHVWDPQRCYFRGRYSDGSWVEPLLPTRLFDPQYVEGDAWQWRWMVPHDVAGLVELFGSERRFVRKLDTFFGRTMRRPDTLLPDTYYWHGNEPDIHAAYLFNDAGRPDLTQKWVRWVMRTRYGTGAGGLDGNDDYGTLSAWYLFSALGLYPVAGSSDYWIGSPLFERAVLHLQGGDFEVVAHDAAPGNYYVQAAELNGMEWNRPHIDHADLVGGGRLELWMGAKPSQWGR